MQYELTIYDGKGKSKSLAKGTYQECIVRFNELNPSEIHMALVMRDDGLMMNRLLKGKKTTWYGTLDTQRQFSFSALSKLHKYIKDNKCILSLVCVDKGNNQRGYDPAYYEIKEGKPSKKKLSEDQADDIVDAILLALPEGFGSNITKLVLSIGYENPREHIDYWLEDGTEGSTLYSTLYVRY